MHSANLTTAKLKRISLFISAIFVYTLATAQENSPYSRYGIGDLIPNRNIVSRGMGGISTGFADFQSINLSNPAALGSLATTTFDIGGEVDLRSLKSNTTNEKFKSVNTLVSYLQLGFPITPKKWKPGNAWGVSFGLRPVTRINYKIGEARRISGIDSIQTLYEGSGGVNQANIATGVTIGNFSAGVSGGYSFGNRNYSTRIHFINDTTTYYNSTTESNTKFGGGFINAGLQYKIKIDKDRFIRLGASANFQQNLDAKQDKLNATFTYNSDGVVVHIDTVTSTVGQKGIIKLPASYSGGFTYNDLHWTLGADVDFSQWSQYSSYGQKDAVKNNVTFRAGAQYFPATLTTPISKYWNFVRYRAGFYYGNDYIQNGVSNRPDYAVTLGAGFPLTTLQRRSVFDDYVTLNTGVEIGQRGNKQSQSLRESYARIMIGITIDSRWFVKRKYD